MWDSKPFFVSSSWGQYGWLRTFNYKICRNWVLNIKKKWILVVLFDQKEGQFQRLTGIGTMYPSISVSPDISQKSDTKEKKGSSILHRLERSHVIHFLDHFIQVQFCLLRKELLSPGWAPSQLILNSPSEDRTDCCPVEVALRTPHWQEMGAPDSSFNPIAKSLYLWFSLKLGLGNFWSTFFIEKK